MVFPFRTNSVVILGTVVENGIECENASSPSPATGPFSTWGIRSLLSLSYESATMNCTVNRALLGLVAAHEHAVPSELIDCPSCTGMPSAAATCACVTSAHASLGSCADSGGAALATSTHDTATATSARDCVRIVRSSTSG